jgi:hypothetical protein
MLALSATLIFLNINTLLHPYPKFHIGAWTYEAQEDRFTKLKSCRLFRHSVTYAHGALVFHLGERADTSEAVYRIDSSKTQPWRASAMELASNGVELQKDALQNPSQGLAPIPARLLMDAKTVTIRASEGARPVRFKIEGFAAAMKAAQTAGCTDESFH